MKFKKYVKDYEEYYRLFEERKNNKKTYNLYSYLKEEYPYMYEEVLDDGFASGTTEFLLFNEIIFEEMVVGFFTVNVYENTIVISNVYIIDMYRRKGLFVLEFLKFYDHFGHYKIAFHNPNKDFMMCLVKNKLALSFKSFISSYFSLSTMIKDDNGRKLLRESYYYSIKKDALIIFSDDENFEKSTLKEDTISKSTNYMNTNKRYSISDFRKFKKEISDNIEEIYDFGEVFYHSNIFMLIYDMLIHIYIFDENNDYNVFFDNITYKYNIEGYMKEGLREKLENDLKSGLVLPESFHLYLNSCLEKDMLDNYSDEYDDENLTTCPLCREKFENKLYCSTCGFNRENTAEVVDFINERNSAFEGSDRRKIKDILNEKLQENINPRRLDKMLQRVKETPNAHMDNKNLHYLNYDELKYLEDNNYITETFDKKYYKSELEKVNMKCLKTMLQFENIKTSGKKKELIERIIYYCSIDTITRFLPFKLYLLTDKGKKVKSFKTN